MFSKRIESVPVSGTVSISDAVRKREARGADVVDLSVGEPAAPTPEPVIQAAKKALDEGKTTYGPSQGVQALRQAIARDHERLRGEPLDPDRVLVTPAKHAILTAMLTLLDPGDEVVIPSPAWVSYAPQVKICGATPKLVPVHEDGQIDVDAVENAIAPETQALLVNSPCNPTGAVQSEETMRAIAEIAADENIAVVSDEVYGKLTYETEFTSAHEVAPDPLELVTVDGVSKAYAMTGWRIGWLAATPKFVDQAIKVQQHSITHPTSFAQYGAIQALDGDQTPVEKLRTGLEQRRSSLVDTLSSLGATFPRPEGAFYVFARFPGAEDGDDFAHRLLEETGVAVVPGEAFGPGGEGHVRISYAASEDQIEDALDRIREVVEG